MATRFAVAARHWVPLIWAAAFVCPFGIPHRATASTPDSIATAQRRRARELVSALAATSFLERQQATQSLTEMGPAASDALRLAMQHPDAEVRFRAQYIVSLLRSRHRAAQIMALRAGQSEQLDELPGWSRFISLVDDTPESRQLYSEILAEDWDLIETTEATPDDADRMLAERAVKTRRKTTSNRARAAVFLFVLTHNGVPLSGDVAEYVKGLCRTSIPRPGTKRDSVLLQLLSLCVARANTPQVANSFLDLVNLYDLEGGLQLVERVLVVNRESQTPGWDDVFLVRKSFDALAKYGGREHIAWLEPYLDDSRVCFVRNASFKTQIRDLALAYSVHLDGQDPSDYSLPRVPLTIRASYYSQQQIGFPNDSVRDEAIEKWQHNWAARVAARQTQREAE